MLTLPTQEELAALRAAAEAAQGGSQFTFQARRLASLASPSTVIGICALIDTQQKEITRLQGSFDS